jgi:hypothetical protein
MFSKKAQVLCEKQETKFCFEKKNEMIAFISCKREDMLSKKTPLL